MFHFDSLALCSAGGYAVITLVTLLAAPGQDRRHGGWRSSLALVTAGNLIAYLAASPLLFVLGWSLTLLPLWRDDAYRPSVRVLHAIGTAALAAAFLHPAPWASFALILLAAVSRKGIFPFHFWVPSAFEQGSPGYLGLLLNGHLGAYALIRFGLPEYQEMAVQALPAVGALAILTSGYAALAAIASSSPRRILALLCTSQAAFILAGLENRNPEGITGALLHWWVVVFATTGLILIYRAVEARTTEAAAPRGMLGLAFHAPRLAVFFAISALALVGLPGTLGFVAEDLLFHGSLESHPLLGIGLPVATALNAVTALRLFTVLFLGRRGIHTPPIPDATPAERWAFTAPALLLIAGGIGPAVLIALRAPSAEWIAGFLR